MLICPRCDGQGQIHGIACGPQGGRMGYFKCSTCKGEGQITEKRMELIKKGEAMREDRITRNVSQREEAKRLGIDVVTYSQMEHGTYDG